MAIPLSLYSSNSLGATISATYLFPLPSQLAGPVPHENCVGKTFSRMKNKNSWSTLINIAHCR